MANAADHILHQKSKYRDSIVKISNILLDISLYATTVCSFFLIAFNPFKYIVLFIWQFILYMFYHRMCTLNYKVKILSYWLICYIAITILGFAFLYSIIHTAYETNVISDNKYLNYALLIIPLIAGIRIWSFFKSYISQYVVRLFTIAFGILFISKCVYLIYCYFV